MAEKEIKIYGNKIKIILFVIIVEAAVILLAPSLYHSYYPILLIATTILLILILSDIFIPRLIMDKEGIFIRWRGFIKWSEIENIDVRYYALFSRYDELFESRTGSMFTSGNLIIFLKQPEETIKRLSILAKIGIGIREVFTSEQIIRVNTFFLSMSVENILDIIADNYFGPLAEKLKRLKEIKDNTTSS